MDCGAPHFGSLLPKICNLKPRHGKRSAKTTSRPSSGKKIEGSDETTISKEAFLTKPAAYILLRNQVLSTNPARKLDNLLLEFLDFIQGEKILARRTTVAYLNDLNDLRQFVRFIDAGNWTINWARTIGRFESLSRKNHIASRTIEHRVYIAVRFADFCKDNQIGFQDWDFIRSTKAARHEWQISNDSLNAIDDLESAIKRFLCDVERLRSKNTLKAYTSDLGGFERFLQGRSVKAITPHRILEYLEGLRGCDLREASAPNAWGTRRKSRERSLSE